MREYGHFSFNKCPIYIHNGASAKFSTDSHEFKGRMKSREI